MTEATMEKLADQIVWRRLATDSAYRHAENAEAQQAREDEISERVWADLVAKHGEPTARTWRYRRHAPR
jgi:hypothetical protein